jgi:hypothetical protein
MDIGKHGLADRGCDRTAVEQARRHALS